MLAYFYIPALTTAMLTIFLMLPKWLYGYDSYFNPMTFLFNHSLINSFTIDSHIIFGIALNLKYYNGKSLFAL